MLINLCNFWEKNITSNHYNNNDQNCNNVLLEKNLVHNVIIHKPSNINLLQTCNILIFFSNNNIVSYKNMMVTFKKILFFQAGE